MIIWDYLVFDFNTESGAGVSGPRVPGNEQHDNV